MKKGNIGLDPNNIPYIQSGKIKKIYLRKYGLKNYAFIKPILTEKNTNLMIGEQDLNWMANAFEKLKALLMDKGWLQWMPFIMIAFVTVAIMVIFVYFFKNLDKLQAFGQSLVEASKILKGGTL